MTDQRFRVSRKSPVRAKLAELTSDRARAELANELWILGYHAKYGVVRGGDAGAEPVMRSLRDLHAKVDYIAMRLTEVEVGQQKTSAALPPSGTQGLDASAVDRLVSQVAGFADG